MSNDKKEAQEFLEAKAYNGVDYVTSKVKQTHNIIDLENRKIILNAVIDEETISELWKAFAYWEAEEKEGQQYLVEAELNTLKTKDVLKDLNPGTFSIKAEDESITDIPWDGVIDQMKMMREEQTGSSSIGIKINSPGGDACSGVCIHDKLKEFKAKYNVPVITEIIGEAASAAGIIFLAGSSRLVRRCSTLMIHSCRIFPYGIILKTSDMKAHTEHMDDIDAVLIDILTENSNKPKEYWKEKIENKESFILGQKIVDLGLATLLI